MNLVRKLPFVLKRQSWPLQQGQGDVLFHHAGGNAHAFGDLRLAQAFEAVQHKGFSSAGREFGEAGSQLIEVTVTHLLKRLSLSASLLRTT